MKRALGAVGGFVFVLTLAPAPACHIEPPCQTTSDCPAAPTCMVNECFSGRCVEQALALRAPCNGGICTADDHCVECIADADCNADPCSPGTCNAGKCVNTMVADGTSCPITGETTCFKAASCEKGVCTPTPVPDGTSCPMPPNTGACSEALCEAGECKVVAKPEGGGCNIATQTCGTVETCQSGACMAAPMPTTCAEASGHESNDTQDAAFDLGSLTDCDQYTICDAITDGDVDWYKYEGHDEECEVNAAVTFTDAIQVCEYWTCTEPSSSSTAMDCPTGTEPDVAPGGQYGCCGAASWGLNPCPGDPFSGNSSANVWIKVTAAAGSCTPYTLTYEF